ncbi:nitrate reductase, delta subunit [Deferribacter desulfuricans SSM1]|uniref:Nitrate reductase, delta subunit n=1 Tax=Deferribacter desulfuricans (strain DSM 14783 / JCM 11476 / NBRC 101012 / SSM1) TaxID=639282 RepID=D3P9Z5_DEFDS|nr:molecular chaperone TorD family protein [Deferribacter desulfuricans]BAI81535.1 nitrate reductase, delta subunit [Deferribacter desulfuricans SSM1]
MIKKLTVYSKLLEYPLDYKEFMCSCNLIGDLKLDFSKIKLSELQEEYVSIFDFNEKSTLYISKHISKNDDERKMFLLAMNEFLKLYGGKPNIKHSPDYLPTILSALYIAINKKEYPEKLSYLTAMIERSVCDILNSFNERSSVYYKIVESLKYYLNDIQKILEVKYA